MKKRSAQRSQLLWICLAVVLQLLSLPPVSSKTTCPEQCLCDFNDGFKRAKCINHNIVDINLGVPANVEVYDLSHNSLQKIEDNAFLKLKLNALVNLNLADNMIFWIGLHAFAGLDNLKILNLSSNRIQALPSDIFWYNKKLEYLDLSKNKFLRISNKPFLSHLILKHLDLSGSQISFLPTKSFEELPNLMELNLSNNLMIEMKIDLLRPLKSLTLLDISQNQLHCNRDFNTFQDWLQLKQISFERQCKSSTMKQEKMFEKMVMADDGSASKEEIDLDELWNITIETTDNKNESKTADLNESESFFDLYSKRMSPVYSLIIGFEIGLVLGIFGTYCLMSRSWMCKKINFKSRRSIIRRRRMEQNEGRVSLLANTNMQENFMTPPAIRRQMSEPQATYRSYSWEARGFNGDAATPNETRVAMINVCPDTPPPAYNQALHDRVLRRG